MLPISIAGSTVSGITVLEVLLADLLHAGALQRGLDVRRVARVGRGAQYDLVLAGGAGRHVLVRAETAHHPDVALHPVPAQPGAIHHAVVGADVQRVALLHAGPVAVEAVGVLHHELPCAQHPGARARLVALLDLEVVDDQRQVAIGAHGLGDVEGDGLLVGHREHELRALAVVQLEQLLDLDPARLAPRLGRLEHRHQHLLAADRVHLLADDLHDPLVHAPARRQPGPHAGAQLPDETGADHQLV